MPHFTLTSFLTGFIPGLIVYYLFGQRINYFILLIAIAVGQAIASVVLVPVFLQLLFAIPLKFTLVPQIISQLIQIPFYAYLIKVILKYDLIRSKCPRCKISA